MEEGKAQQVSTGVLTNLVLEIVQSPVNIALVSLIIYLVYKIVRSTSSSAPQSEPVASLPKLKKRDFTVEELRKYDGHQEDGRILVAVNGSVYDVTRGKQWYGPGGPYGAFGGRDASRGLATFQIEAKEEWDDLSDLKSNEMESVREWEAQFKEKYDLVGKLLKPGEEPTSYSDEEDEPSTVAAAAAAAAAQSHSKAE